MRDTPGGRVGQRGSHHQARPASPAPVCTTITGPNSPTNSVAGANSCTRARSASAVPTASACNAATWSRGVAHGVVGPGPPHHRDDAVEGRVLAQCGPQSEHLAAAELEQWVDPQPTSCPSRDPRDPAAAHQVIERRQRRDETHPLDHGSGSLLDLVDRRAMSSGLRGGEHHQRLGAPGVRGVDDAHLTPDRVRRDDRRLVGRAHRRRDRQHEGRVVGSQRVLDRALELAGRRRRRRDLLLVHELLQGAFALELGLARGWSATSGPR